VLTYFRSSKLISEIKLAYWKARKHGRKEGKKEEGKQDNISVVGSDSGMSVCENSLRRKRKSQEFLKCRLQKSECLGRSREPE